MDIRAVHIARVIAEEEPDGTDYLDWTVAPGHSHESAIVWMYTENRHYWLFQYHRMQHHIIEEFFCTDEETA